MCFMLKYSKKLNRLLFFVCFIQKSVNFFLIKGQILSICSSTCYAVSMWKSIHKWYMKEWVWLCSNKALFIKQAVGHIWIMGPCVQISSLSYSLEAELGKVCFRAPQIGGGVLFLCCWYKESQVPAEIGGKLPFDN